ncbi:hypothetical protein SAMN04488074_104310 [Lentzea albidocapillata subsp. violacea]|uniref:Uncharacterized protein n=1 Tax=Lentzea albidocapillata subsp. violacea TaxID=128104 RepID=A0A1G8ZC60_9PSEU|nr:hypothetical protein [Lentzea albidocapillata]SDK12533.1 hypothetical protein SAMN04488074_104310 [Lentzea albidocapillata subsp. violacea]
MKEPFSVKPVDGGVQVDMTKSLAWGWGRALRRLSRSYVRGNPFYALRQPLRIWTQPSLLRHLHPDVAESSQESKAFLRRHRDVLADRELVERVQARWTGPRPVVLTHAEVDEWIAVLGQLRLFELLAFTQTAIAWASTLQKLLVLAVAPGTFADPEDAEKAATDQTA